MDPRVLTSFAFGTLNVFSDIVHDLDLEDQVYLRGVLCLRLAALSYCYIRGSYPKYLMALCLLCNSLYWWCKLPCTWESCQWAAQLDCVQALCLLLGSQNDLADTVQDMFAAYYTASGVWKLNNSFLDPESSRATVFLAQHLSMLVPVLGHDLTKQLLQVLKPGGPAATLALELLMGVSLLLGRRWRTWTVIGLASILLFHLSVCLTPKPHNISNFGLHCAARLPYLCSPEHLREAARPRHLLVGGGLTALLAAYGVGRFSPLDWSFLCFSPAMCLLMLALCLEARGSFCAVSCRTTRPIWMWLFVFIAWFYSYGHLILGLQEEATPNMFSNLQVHGGSNHLLLPTGLLFHAFSDRGDDHPFGGGVIRVEQTDSKWLTEIYPNDMTSVLEPKEVVPLLREVGFAMFNPGANRVLGLIRRGWVPAPRKLQPYSVPALEMKRLLAEAMQKDRHFRAVLAQLPGSRGDEVWRQGATARRFEVQVANGTVQSCQVWSAQSNGTKACEPTDLPMVSYEDTPWLLRHVSVYHSYPILAGRSSISCFGP